MHTSIGCINSKLSRCVNVSLIYFDGFYNLYYNLYSISEVVHLCIVGSNIDAETQPLLVAPIAIWVYPSLSFAVQVTLLLNQGL